MKLWLGVAAGVTLAAGITACDSARSTASACESKLKPTEIHVKTREVSYTTDLTFTSAALTQMARPPEGRIVNGLTRTSMRSAVVLNGNGITNRMSGKHCLRPVIDVELAFDPMTVFVSSELTEGSCRFATTMRHELEHVRVYREFLEAAATDVETQLREYFGNRVFYFESAADAQARLNQETSERVGPFVEQAMNRVQEKQAPLDTREEYDRLERVCGGA